MEIYVSLQKDEKLKMLDNSCSQVNFKQEDIKENHSLSM